MSLQSKLVDPNGLDAAHKALVVEVAGLDGKWYRPAAEAIVSAYLTAAVPNAGFAAAALPWLEGCRGHALSPKRREELERLIVLASSGSRATATEGLVPEQKGEEK